MFTFLTRMGRLFVVAIVMGATASILGFGILNYSPVANKHHSGASASAGCTVAMGAVISGQQRLLVSASGLTPSSSYLEAQTGVQSVMVTTDGTGSVSDQSLYYHGSGDYSISLYFYYWSNNKLVQATATSCSAHL
jgi:hypothetical protein